MPEYVRLVMHGVGGEKISIRLLDGIKFVDVPLAGELVVYHHDGGCAVLVQLPQFFGGEYPCPVHLGEYFLYMADVIGRRQDIPQMRLVIVFQLLDHFFFCVLVQLEIGLERSQDAVLLSFHNLVVFVYGEVEGGHQLSVLPGVISGIALVFLPAVSSFFIPKLLGGGQYFLIGNVIENQFITVGEWNFGSAISVIMAFVMMAIMYLVRYVEKRNSGNRKEKKA